MQDWRDGRRRKQTDNAASSPSLHRCGNYGGTRAVNKVQRSKQTAHRPRPAD